MKCDIEILSETWGECNHYNEIEGYNFIKNGTQKDPSIKKGRSSGGMIIYYKKNLEKLIKTIKQTPNYVWIELKKELFHNLNKNLKLCVIYNPPINSRYYNPNVIEDIGLDILDVCENDSPILLIGDMNARISNIIDYTTIDNKEIKNSLIEENHPKINRNNCDIQINKEGLKLIDLCKSFDLMILNGRTSGDYWGNFTHYNKNKGASTVDLSIASCKIFENINNFRVMPQLDLTDHCKIITQIDNIRIPDNSTKTETYNWLKLPNRYKWNENYANIFKETLYSEKIEKLITETEQLIDAGLIESTGIKIQEIFRQTADTCLVKTNSKGNPINNKNNNSKKKKKKKWYDTECKNIKNRVKISARRKHRNPLNEEVREEHKNILKTYKRLCRYKQIEFWKNEKNKIENENINFWDIWKNLGEEEVREQSINADGKEWETYFSNLYKKPNELEDNILDNINLNKQNELLNSPFKMEELINTIKALD